MQSSHFRLLPFLFGLQLSLSPLLGQGPGRLPPPVAPAQNPITPAKAVLGKILFWDEQLSSNNRVSCGTCHTFAAGGGDLRRARHPGLDGTFGTPDDRFGSPGVPAAGTGNAHRAGGAFGFDEQVTGRSTPSALTGAYFRENFWDGRAADTFRDPQTGLLVIPTGGSLENQALGPILDSVEMSHDGRTWVQVIAKLAASDPMALATNLPPDIAQAIQGNATYPALFQAAFGTPTITASRIGMAIATYERTLVPDQTPFDLGTMTLSQQMGSNMFGQRCAVCHSGALLSDGQFHNLGRRPIAEDAGRQAVTSNPADRGRFKTPSLRNVGLRSTFFHDGGLTTLSQVVAFYAGGGGPHADNKDPLLAQAAGLPPMAQSRLVDFLTNALTDPRVAQGLPPFDRPTLRSQLLLPDGDLYGAGAPGTGGLVPRMLAGVPANIGNVDFKIGIANAVGGAGATLLLGLRSTLPGTQLLGVPVHVDLGGVPVQTVLQGAGGVAGVGHATILAPLPADPGLIGLWLYGQWFVWDGAAPVAAATAGARFAFF